MRGSDHGPADPYRPIQLEQRRETRHIVTMLLWLVQAGPETADQVARMTTALTVIAVAAVLVGLGFIGLVIVNVALMRSVSRAVRAVELQVGRLGPRAEPLIDNVSRLALDVRGVSDNVRRGVTDLVSTIEDLNRSLRDAGDAGKARVREFTAVLDIVKAEAEEILLDSAATARGIHSTAEALRGAGTPRKRGRGARRSEHEDEEAIP
jgi:uncharacterized protein YoxC